MYSKPAVEHFGSVRQLTLLGLNGTGDPLPASGIGDGCTIGGQTIPGVCTSGS